MSFRFENPHEGMIVNVEAIYWGVLGQTLYIHREEATPANLTLIEFSPGPIWQHQI